VHGASHCAKYVVAATCVVSAAQLVPDPSARVFHLVRLKPVLVGAGSGSATTAPVAILKVRAVVEPLQLPPLGLNVITILATHCA
jgi:hypothetical protein